MVCIFCEATSASKIKIPSIVVASNSVTFLTDYSDWALVFRIRAACIPRPQYYVNLLQYMRSHHLSSNKFDPDCCIAYCLFYHLSKDAQSTTTVVFFLSQHVRNNEILTFAFLAVFFRRSRGQICGDNGKTRSTISLSLI